MKVVEFNSKVSAFKFPIERPIPIVATNPLPSTTPFLGLWAQQVHSPLLKRLGPKYFLQFFLGTVTQVGTRPSARSFLVIFPLFLVTVQEVFAKVNSSQFPSRVARSHEISSRRTSHSQVMFSSKRSIFFIVLFSGAPRAARSAARGRSPITKEMW